MKKTLTDKIDHLQTEIASYGKLDSQVLKNINYKFRLDWNYYSNKMEGGTLTRDETRSVMVENIEIHGKPYKDVAEMKGHDEQVVDILGIAKGELRISEKRIKEIHKVIMYEENPSKRKLIGEWKEQDNEVINYKGEKFQFLPKEQVPNAVHKLLDKTNADLDHFFKGKLKKHPIEIAITFHKEFLEIHPFYDGNGRMARILTNLILMSCGLPIFIIKEDTKKSYYTILANIQCYNGKIDLLENFLAERVIESQKLILSAIKGEDISEDDDLDKRLALLDKEIDGEDESKEIKVLLNPDAIKENYEKWIKPLFSKLISTTIKFNKYYLLAQHSVEIRINDNGKYYTFDTQADYDYLEEAFTQARLQHEPRIAFRTCFGPYKKGGLNSFDCIYGIEVIFRTDSYTVIIDEFDMNTKKRAQKTYTKKLLHQYQNKEDIRQIDIAWGETLLNHLQYHIKNVNNSNGK